MTGQHKTRISKFLSLVLRHQPQKIGLVLDDAGWANVSELLEKMAAHAPIAMNDLEEIVTTNSKQRFAFNEHHTMIRANQGHSVAVALQLNLQAPPEHLYHGTVAKFADAIRREGLRKMSRHHVHLSADTETAEKVGSRHGKAVILKIHSGDMHRLGVAFYRSQNGVWLTDEVLPGFIDFSVG